MQIFFCIEIAAPNKVLFLNIIKCDIKTHILLQKGSNNEVIKRIIISNDIIF